MQVYIAQLRQELRAVGRLDAIRTEDAGYLMHVGAEEFDLYRFNRLSGCGRDHLALQAYRRTRDLLNQELGVGGHSPG